MERLNDHRQVHNQCARACDYIHVFDFCYDWMMATKACKFASVRRSFNLERLSGNKSLACIYADGRTDRRR